MTGSSDGVVRMWSLDFVEVPIMDKVELKENVDELSIRNGRDDATDNATTPTILQSLTQQLAKKMSISYESGNDTLNSLQEILAANVYVTTPQPQRKNQELNTTQSEDEPSSDTENCENQNDDTLDNTSDGGGDIAEDKSIFDSNYTEENGESPPHDRAEDIVDGVEKIKQNSGSVQTGTITSDFVVVSNEEITQVQGFNGNTNDESLDHDESYGSAFGSCGGRRRRRRLQSDGYTWSRQLVFRAKLTMHTAFERPDNVDPAAVTALAVSKDHRTIYVGDEKGRVFSWSVSSRPGKGKIRNCKYHNN